jgi:hypothetical protein
MRSGSLTRRQLLKTSAALAAGWCAADAWGNETPVRPANLYADLLKTWCDRMIATQIDAPQDPKRHGALMCPGCGIIHGRCADAMYPLMHMARATGERKYLDAAERVQAWSDNVSGADGSWRNDVQGNAWKGITVFATIALGEALHHHGALVEPAVRARWRDRLARAAKFLDGFMTMKTGNINYPVTCSLALTLAGQVLDQRRYTDHGRELAHAALGYFSANHLLFGESHDQAGITAKKCRAVDLGYNVEESLPALALYSLLTGDGEVREQVIAALRSHMEFMLPDGAWDNSWGVRNYKWSWWGSRTSDGCQPGYALMAMHDPRFAEVAWRNLELLASCTHGGLLYGGPDFHAQGLPACVHHTFTHAKALATVLDRGGKDLFTKRPPRLSLPRDAAYGLKTFPEIGTHLASVGDWLATVTENDWEYDIHGGGHATGGALTMLYHQKLGPVLTASMTKYQLWEPQNQQRHGDYPTMPLAPRIEVGDGSSLNDFGATLVAEKSAAGVTFDARGRVLTSRHQQPSGGEAHYRWVYRLMDSGVEIVASADAAGQLVLPVICRQTELVERPDPRTVRIGKHGGTLVLAADAQFDAPPRQRVFNLVPGFQCAGLTLALAPGRTVTVKLTVA